MFVNLCLVNAYRRRELESTRFIVSRRMAANGVAVGCGRAIARVPIAPDVLLRLLLLHMSLGYSLRETVVRAKMANWTDISDVALLKRLRNSEEWLRFMCVELLRENAPYPPEAASSRRVRVVDGTIVKEPGKTGSQWRILYSVRLPILACDFFEVTATTGKGSGESLNRLPVGPRELILADAGYCSIAGIDYVRQHGADVLVRVNPQSFLAYSAFGRRISLLTRLRTLSKEGQIGEWRVVLHGQGSAFVGRLCAVRKSDCAIQQAHRRLQRRASKKQMITRAGTFEFAKYVIVFTTSSSGSTAEILKYYRCGHLSQGEPRLLDGLRLARRPRS